MSEALNPIRDDMPAPGNVETGHPPASISDLETVAEFGPERIPE